MSPSYESESNTFYFVTHLSLAVLSPYLAWRVFVTMASVTYLDAMITWLPWQPQLYVNNCFALSHIRSLFGIQVRWDNRHQRHTSMLWKLGCHGNHSETSITALF